MAKSKVEAAAQRAADHHTTLTLFALVGDLMEGGYSYDTGSHRTAEKIIKLCKAERQRQLGLFDAAMAQVASSSGNGGVEKTDDR